jgi:immunity protein, SdpI family
MNTVRWLSALQWLVVGALFAAALVVWSRVPDSVPVHFGISGAADRYGGKPEGLLAVPVVALGVLVLGRLLPRVDPLRARYAEFATAYALSLLAIELCLGLTYATILAVMLGVPINPGTVIGPTVGVLLGVIGLVLDQVRPNWFFGIRTPWTLSSERSWTATHRAGRWVFLLMGALFVLAGLVQSLWLVYLAIATCLGGMLGLVIYSFLVWRSDPERSG